jgi:uncharacterized OB-fold protein
MVLVATRGFGRSELQFPPAEFVHDDEQPVYVLIGPLGWLYTYTVVHAGNDELPYSLAMVDFEPGVRVFGRLLQDEGNPVIGGSVRVVPFALPDGTPDYAFRADSAAAT